MRRKRIIAIYTGIIAAVALLATDHLGLDLGKSMFIVVVAVIVGSVLMEKFIKGLIKRYKRFLFCTKPERRGHNDMKLTPKQKKLADTAINTKRATESVGLANAVNLTMVFYLVAALYCRFVSVWIKGRYK